MRIVIIRMRILVIQTLTFKCRQRIKGTEPTKTMCLITWIIPDVLANSPMDKE